MLRDNGSTAGLMANSTPTSLHTTLVTRSSIWFRTPTLLVSLPSISSVKGLTLSAYVKAAARDIKAYLRGVNSETLVGYAAVDGEPDFRNTLAEYLTCGEESIVVDLYGE